MISSPSSGTSRPAEQRQQRRLARPRAAGDDGQGPGGECPGAGRRGRCASRSAWSARAPRPQRGSRIGAPEPVVRADRSTQTRPPVRPALARSPRSRADPRRRAGSATRSPIPASASSSGGSRIHPPEPTTSALPPLLDEPPVAHPIVRSAISPIDGSWETSTAVVPSLRTSPTISAADLVRALLVKFASRLVGEQQLRPVRERDAQRRPLSLAAGELAGAGEGGIGEPDRLEQLVAGAPPAFHGPRPGARAAASRLTDREISRQDRARVLREEADACLAQPRAHP